MSVPSSIIHLGNVTKKFGDKRAVADISVKILPGEIIGFVGPNGAGKTTTIGLLMGFIRPSSGTVTLFGDAIVTPSTAHTTHRRIGYCSGDMSLFDNLSGKQYLEFLASRFGVKKELQDRLKARLEPQLTSKIKHLSRGNKQKIALIGALQHDPELIILDEPTSGLDPLMQDVFLDIIREEAARGATVFMSSHILSEVANVCSRILFMKQGKIIVDQSMKDIEKEAGKIVTIAGVKVSDLPKGSTPLATTTHSARFRYNGDIQALLRWVSILKLKDISIEDRDLDDIFKDRYREEAES